MIILLSLAGIIPDQAIKLYNSFGNKFIAVGVFLIISYCVGWICSEMGELLRLLKKIFLKLQNKRWLLVLTIGIITIAYVKKIYDLVMYIKLVYFITIITIFIQVISKDDNKKIPDKQIREKFLIKQMKLALEEYYQTSIEKNDVPAYGLLCHDLIQIDSKYNRIHNYSSSKSFSKNLAIAFIFVSASFLYLMFQKNGIKFDVIYGLCFLLSLLAINVLQKRYRFFEHRTNVFSAVSFIDFVKNRNQK